MATRYGNTAADGRGMAEPIDFSNHPVFQALHAFQSISIFTSFYRTSLLGSFYTLLKTVAPFFTGFSHQGPNGRPPISAWADFTESLWAAGGDFCSAVYRLARADVNLWTLSLEKPAAEPLNAAIQAAAENDLKSLKLIAACDFSFINTVLQHFEPEDALTRIIQESKLINTKREKAAEYFSLSKFTEEIRKNGAGPIGLHTMFYWDNGLVPASRADTVRLANLSGYEAERALVVENTRRFLENGAANNLLLYGDRGTGKSATVKAVCNDFAPRGLRLLQIRKQDFDHWREIFAALSNRAQKFILFIDDLSFETQDDTLNPPERSVGRRHRAETGQCRGVCDEQPPPFCAGKVFRPPRRQRRCPRLRHHAGTTIPRRPFWPYRYFCRPRAGRIPCHSGPHCPRIRPPRRGQCR